MLSSNLIFILKQQAERKANGQCVSCGVPSTKTKCEDCRLNFNARQLSKYHEHRKRVISHYGGKCVCCGELEQLFLEIDHVQGGGNKDRKSKVLAVWLVKHNYPEGFQILCANCNKGKERNKGICPHKTKN